MKSPHGHVIKTLNLERTICDVLRSKNELDIQFVNAALKRYGVKNEREPQCVNFRKTLDLESTPGDTLFLEAKL